jgi:hypothetical protein
VSLESKIDELYKGPLGEFVAARTALARTLKGEEARRVKALPKPTVVPWAVNQLYWHARPVYDRLASAGEKLRAAQIAALKGRAADVRPATEAHRNAVAGAVTEALRLAVAPGAHPGADELTRTLEAASVARDLPEPPGRLTKALRPAGFEALAGVPVKAVPREARVVSPPAAAPPPAPPSVQHSATRTRGAHPSSVDHARAAREAREKKAREARDRRQRIADERQRKQAAARAEQEVARARAAEARARAAWERARNTLAAAEEKRSRL